MPTATKPSARELRRLAKANGIKGWADMDLDELIEATSDLSDDDEDEDEAPAKPVRKSKKSGVKKGSTPASTKSPRQKEAAAKKKAAAPAREVAENGNPFRDGTQEWYITEALLKGGKRTKLVEGLKKKIEVNPRTESGRSLEEEIDYRLLTCAQRLQKQHGFEYVKEGRGFEGGSVKVVAP